jgi:hypothetical protein
MNKIDIKFKSTARLLLMTTFGVLALLLLSGSGSEIGKDSTTPADPVAGESSVIANPAEEIPQTPTPKTVPFFIGPRDKESHVDDREIPQSLPHEALSELPGLILESDPRVTPEDEPQVTPESEPKAGEVEDQEISITTIEEPEKRSPISEKNIFGYEYGEIQEEHGLDLMDDAGAVWVRRAGIWWPDVEPAKGVYDWSKLAGFEKEFLLARQRGMNVILIVRGAPEWAQADPPYNRTCGRIREEAFDSFAKFLRELVKKYSYAPYHVKYWEIWNEPDVDPSLIPEGNEWMGCWGDMNDPYYGGEYYAELLKVVYPEMKSANPDVQVLIGGLLLDCDPNDVPEHKTDCNASNFLEGILKNGGGEYFDGVSFHAYDADHSWLGGYYNGNWHSEADRTGPVLLAKVAFINHLLDQYGVENKELINTEAALLCIYSEKSVCEMTKAYYVVHSYVSAYSVGLEANLWYFWMDRRAGLFQQDLTPLPAIETYAFAREHLSHAAYQGEVTDFMPSVRVYAFDRDSGHFWVVWSMDGSRHIISLPGVPSAIKDAFGRNLTPRGTIEVDLMPLYIEWDD